MKLVTNITFETFDEAMNIHKKLFEIMRNNKILTYADLYLLLHPDEIDCKKVYYDYGWTNLWEAKVVPGEDYINGDWILVMPKIKLLKKEND